MNYKESKEILEKIKKAKKILLNCHRGPDADSVGSALALSKVLLAMNKEFEVVCPSEIPDDLKFLEGARKIKRVNFTNFDFSDYDLFIVLDSSNYSMVSGSKTLPVPDIELVVIDHHHSNDGFGKVNLIDEETTSVGELLYKIFEDWKVPLDETISQCLLTGIIGDTGCFQYKGADKNTLEMASKLMEEGADKDQIIYHLFRSVDFKEIKLWSRFIENMKIDEKYRFVWSALPVSQYKEFGELPYAKEEAASLFFPIVKDTDFGVVMVETAEKILSVSFRARSDFDVSEIAEEIGGGGHMTSAGAKIEGLDFNSAVLKVLNVSKKYARKNLERI